MLFSPSRLCSFRMRCRPFISNRLALIIDALQGEWRVNFLNVNTVNCSCTASQRGTNFCEEVNSHAREHIEVSYRTSTNHILQTIPKPQESSERSSRRPRRDIVGPFALECQAFRLQIPGLIHMSNEGYDGRGSELLLDNDLVKQRCRKLMTSSGNESSKREVWYLPSYREM